MLPFIKVLAFYLIYRVNQFPPLMIFLICFLLVVLYNRPKFHFFKFFFGLLPYTFLFPCFFIWIIKNIGFSKNTKTFQRFQAFYLWFVLADWRKLNLLDVLQQIISCKNIGWSMKFMFLLNNILMQFFYHIMLAFTNIF